MPIGVAIWGNDISSLKIRFPKSGERLTGISTKDAQIYLEIVKRQLYDWLSSDSLPYAKDLMVPLSEEWWDHVRKLLQFKVRVDEPKSIECIDPDIEIDFLYEAAVKPKLPRRQRAKRNESILKSVLGKDLSGKISFKAFVNGFEDKPVPVTSAIQNNNDRLVIDLINLATPDAVDDADAFASRILRIKESSLNTTFVLGYVSSPNGLNGEGYMKDWIEKKSETTMYNVIQAPDKFRIAVSDGMKLLNVEPSLYQETNC